MSDPYPARLAERQDKRTFLQKLAEFIHPGPDSKDELIETLVEAQDNEAFLITGYPTIRLVAPKQIDSGTVTTSDDGLVFSNQATLSWTPNARAAADTEVILHAYREWGPSCVDRLRGMFAFAIWDRSTKALFIARDRIGGTREQLKLFGGV